MKKSTLGVIITAVVMIVVGIGMCIGGVMAAGGFDAAVNELIGSGIDLERFYHLEEEVMVGESQAVYGANDVNSLELNLGAANVKIIESDQTDEISVKTEGNFKVFVKNKILYVRTENDLEEHTMILEIPKNIVFEKVDISGNSCSLEIQYLEVKEVDVEADAGMIDIEELVAGDAEFEIGAGEIVINRGDVQRCDASVGMGNFKYTGNVAKYGDVECGLGNAEFYLDGKETDYNYEIDCSAGSVTIGNEIYGGVATEKMINHQADATIEIDCSMGNVVVTF